MNIHLNRRPLCERGIDARTPRQISMTRLIKNSTELASLLSTSSQSKKSGLLLATGANVKHYEATISALTRLKEHDDRLN